MWNQGTTKTYVFGTVLELHKFHLAEGKTRTHEFDLVLHSEGSDIINRMFAVLTQLLAAPVSIAFPLEIFSNRRRIQTRGFSRAWPVSELCAGNGVSLYGSQLNILENGKRPWYAGRVRVSAGLPGGWCRFRWNTVPSHRHCTLDLPSLVVLVRLIEILIVSIIRQSP